MRAALPAADPAPGVIARMCSQRVDTALALNPRLGSPGSRNNVNSALTAIWEPPSCSGIACGAARARRRLCWLRESRPYLGYGLTNRPTRPVTPLTCGDGGEPNFSVTCSRVSPGGSSFGAKSVAISVNV